MSRRLKAKRPCCHSEPRCKRCPVVLKRLEAAKLLTVVRDADGALLSIDAHPLLREYFAHGPDERTPAVSP